LIASQRSLYSYHPSHCLLISLYFCIFFYPIFSLSLSRSFDNHRLGCLINFLDVVLFFLAAPLFSQLLCPRTYFALSKSNLLFPVHIVAHRLLRRPHDGASASPTFTLGGRCGYFPLVRFKGRVFDDDESILFYLSLPQLWRTRIHFLLSSILSPAHLLLLFNLSMPDDFSLTDPSFRLFRMLERLVPVSNAIKPLNNWVRLGQCSLVIATLDSICITVEFQVMFG